MTWNQYITQVISITQSQFESGLSYCICRANKICMINNNEHDYYAELKSRLNQLPDKHGIYKWPYSRRNGPQSTTLHLQPRIDFLNSLKDKE